jgi:hypothetical protein
LFFTTGIERERKKERVRERELEGERVALFCFTQQGIKLQEKRVIYKCSRKK